MSRRLVRERTQLVQGILISMDVVTVYVPADESHPTVSVVRGSAIVGQVLENGDVLAFYEGNVYDSPSLERFANRALIAAARLAADAPTRAKAIVPAASLVRVGEYDRSGTGRVAHGPGGRTRARCLARPR